MIIDPHKDLTISYNFLNLPSQIVKSGGGGGTLSLTYDALGRKWRKQSAGEIRDYISGIEYKDGKVESIQAPEGRLTAIYDEYGVSLTHYRAEYWHRDHLGNTRLAFSDENHDGAIDIYDNPYTPENESEIVQENHYYPFGLNHEGLWYGAIGPRNKYQYNGKELNEDFGLNWYDYGARWQDPAAGRWWSVDALAELPHNVSLNPYHYVANNPIKNIDPDGRDWYENNDGEQVWFNNRDASYTDDDGVEWSNIGEERLFFGGKNLIYYTQSEGENGNLTLNMEVYDAVSGRENGGFDYSEENQAAKGSGPIPEGDYSINPSLVQSYSDLSSAQKAASKIGRGKWPGGRYAWGENRVWIDPSSVEVTNPVTGETVTRTDMSIHGGKVPGSAGCIDCHKDAPRFFKSLSKSKQSRIPLRVKYPKKS